MNRSWQLFIILSVIIISSCTSPKLEFPVWLTLMQGKWETGTKNGYAGEEWIQLNDTLMKGKGWVSKDGELRVMEELSIFISNNHMYYGATVLDQNNGEMIIYTLTDSDNSLLIFENREHDYPTKIRYDFRGDSLVVVISGKTDGDSQTFNMKKHE